MGPWLPPPSVEVDAFGATTTTRFASLAGFAAFASSGSSHPAPWRIDESQ